MVSVYPASRPVRSETAAPVPAEEALLEGLISDLSVSQADAAALLEALPEVWPRLPIRRYLTPKWMKWNE